MMEVEVEWMMNNNNNNDNEESEWSEDTDQ